MARFSGDWEKEFRPQWELSKPEVNLNVGQVGGASDPRRNKVCTLSNLAIILIGLNQL
jgi:hypothetical protein